MSWTEAVKARRAPFGTCCPARIRAACLLLVLAGWLWPVAARAVTTNYTVRGVLKGVKLKEHQVVIAHEEIPGFMDAMTMPFRVKGSVLLTNIEVGEPIRFALHVTETESWVDRIERLSAAEAAATQAAVVPPHAVASNAKTNDPAAGRAKNPLRQFKFTNELGQPVSLEDFRGQAVALTFFFTRCPIPEFCPRLSRNFEAVQRKLSAMPNAPTNWHLVSVTFDPTHDTPEVLKAYGAGYHYDPAHWSFLTGPQDRISELARLCDVKFEADNGFFNHNFRTLIIDPANRLQMVFPTSGDLSAGIVQELLKAMGGTNRSSSQAAGAPRASVSN